ncbi:MAG: hypothetical protein ABEJ05_07400 [Haloglomus sp.]
MNADADPEGGPDAGPPTAGSEAPGDDLWDALEAAGDPFGPVVDEAVELAAAGTPVAIVGAPFGGRERVLARIADRLDARHERLSPGADPPALDGATVVADAHHAYRRTVGGFAALDTLLDRVARADAPVVTGWNQHAWSYLLHAREVDEAFEAVAVPAVGRETMTALVRRWSPSVTFRVQPREDRGLLGVERRTRRLPLLGEREVPVPSLSPDAIGRRGTDADPETAVLRRLTDLADGNPGVARALWVDRVDETGDDGPATVAPTDLRTPVERADERARERDRARRERGTAGAGTPSSADDAGLDRKTAFCCRLVLASERLSRAVVRECVDGADRRLDRLERRGYLTTTDAMAAMRPGAVPDAVALTDGRLIP